MADRPLLPADLYQAAGASPAYPQPTDPRLVEKQFINEGAAMADPFGVNMLTRLFGGQIPDQVWLNESHGLANKQQDQYLALARKLLGK